MDDRLIAAEAAIAAAEAQLESARLALSAAIVAHGEAVKAIIRESLGGLGPWTAGSLMLSVRCTGPRWIAYADYGTRRTMSAHGDTPAAACLAALDAVPSSLASEVARLRARVTHA